MISFLSSECVFDMTGFRRAHAQRRWLTEHGLPFFQSGNGKIKVTEQDALDFIGRTKQKKKGPELRFSG